MGSLLPVVVIGFLVAADFTSPISCANILVPVTTPLSTSHTKCMSAISKTLTQRGHNVTILTSSVTGLREFEPGTYTKALHYNFQDIPPGIQKIQKDVFHLVFEKNILKKLTAFQRAFELNAHGCGCVFDNDKMLNQLRKSDFDIVVGDTFDACDSIIAAYLNVPFIAVTTGFRYPFFHEHVFGIPAPSSYVPFGIFPLSDRMSFFDRVLSFIEHHVVIRGFGILHYRSLNAIKDAHGIAPDRSVQELLARAELWLCVTNFVIDFPRPTAPNWVAIGGITNSPAKSLSKMYEEFIAESGEHGFIVFALGTHFTEFPDMSMPESFAQAFSELPQRVIWRYTGPRPRHLGNNTMLVDWLPQNDLLGHPGARLLIYHGGLNGILEAIYHAVPMVIMPMFAEQESNSVKVEVKGMGKRLPKDTVSYEAVKVAIGEVLGNTRYAENMVRYSAMFKDTLSKPNETAVFWIEHVLKFGGSHLRLQATQLHPIQLHSIDVLAFLVAIFLVTVFLFFSCCKRCFSCCSKNSKTKVE